MIETRRGPYCKDLVDLRYVFKSMKKYEEKNLGRQKLAQYLNEKFNEFLECD